MTHHSFDPDMKRRLTERAQLIVAADFLISKGFAADDLPEQLARFYYVDIDLLNEVLSTRAMRHQRQPAEFIWKKVA